jgi:hypothetical protein
MKQAAMADFRERYAKLKAGWTGPRQNAYDGWVARANNAAFGAQGAYDDLVPAFETLFERQGRDWPRFYTEVKRIAALPTSEERRSALQAATGILQTRSSPSKDNKEITVPDIHIERNHTLGIAGARKVAHQWIEQAEQEFGLECVYTPGEDRDVATFTRAGIDGTVEVTARYVHARCDAGLPVQQLQRNDRAEDHAQPRRDAQPARGRQPLRLIGLRRWCSRRPPAAPRR